MKYRANTFYHASLAGLALTVIAAGCGKPGGGGGGAGTIELAGGLSPEKPSEINSTISKSVAKSATGSGSESGLARASRGIIDSRGVLGVLSAITLDDPEQECDSNGTPIAHPGEPTDNQGGLSSLHSEFALRRFYCIMAHDSGSPETVQGAINGTNGILCGLEKGLGFTFDGVERTVDLAAALTSQAAKDECGIQLEENDLQMLSQVTWTLTASSPAAINPNFERGVSVKGVYQGMTAMEFAVAGKVGTDRAEIIVRSGSADAKQYDGYAASLDFATGTLRFDARFDRMEKQGDSSGGWSRRIQLLAGLKLENDEVVGLESIDGFYSNAQSGGGYSTGGEIQTISGGPATGLKTFNYGFNLENASVADLLVASNYGERQDQDGVKASDRCYSIDDSATCDGLTGITLDDGPMSFLMVPGDGHTPVWTWLAELKAVDFAQVELK